MQLTGNSNCNHTASSVVTVIFPSCINIDCEAYYCDLAGHFNYHPALPLVNDPSLLSIVNISPSTVIVAAVHCRIDSSL